MTKFRAQFTKVNLKKFTKNGAYVLVTTEQVSITLVHVYSVHLLTLLAVYYYFLYLHFFCFDPKIITNIFHFIGILLPWKIHEYSV